MDGWIWMLNAAAIAALIVLFYRSKIKWVNKGILIVPLLVYVLFSVEDLLDLISLERLAAGNAGMRTLILLFCLFSVVFYLIFIFHEIKESNDREVRLKDTLRRISLAAIICVLFFTVVYTSIYKLFGASSFHGDGIGSDLLTELVAFLYFSVATFTTVGYGDIAAVDSTSRLVVVMQIAFSFITVAYALSMLGLFRKILGDMPEEEVEAEIDVSIDTGRQSGGGESNGGRTDNGGTVEKNVTTSARIRPKD
ncbi:MULTISPECIES: ion channel [Paenibacillus]|nr:MULTISPECIES: ion channel [Paenibacillus]